MRQLGFRRLLLGVALATASCQAFAQGVGVSVPAIEGGDTAAAVGPPVSLFNTESVPLNQKERAGVALASQYANRRELPVAGDGGAVVFLFGSTLPSVVCAPLYVCDIQLQAGEVVNDVNIGDSVRWKVSPSVSGSGGAATTHVLVKPTDSGLTTDLIIATNERTYTIKLVSTLHSWMPLVSFDYPDDINRAWASYRERQVQNDNATTLPSGRNLASLDFNFSISGDSPSWRPLRVYTDGQKTYIQMPPSVSAADMPALVALTGGGVFSSPNTQIVNYRVTGGTFVVDKVLTRAALIAGVGGEQKRVLITYENAGD